MNGDGGANGEPDGPGSWTTTSIVAPDGASGYHLSNLDIETMFFHARNAYLLGLDVDDLWHQPVVPQIKELATRFDAEINSGAALDSRTRIVSRSRRAFVMEQELVDAPSGSVAATCRSVHVTVDATGAVEIPDWLWDAIERRGGGPILDTSASRG